MRRTPGVLDLKRSTGADVARARDEGVEVDKVRAQRRCGSSRQYVAGELSLRLGQLQAVATEEGVGEVARLRYEAETVPLAALGSVVIRALGLADCLCWDSLGCGDALTFGRQAAIGADLLDFGVCARLVDEEIECD